MDTKCFNNYFQQNSQIPNQNICQHNVCINTCMLCNQNTNYINPNHINTTYPTLNILGREQNNQTHNLHNQNITSFMKRSLENADFIKYQNDQCNNTYDDNIQYNSNNYIHTGIQTRGNKKTQFSEINNNIHLSRSIVQPDFRQGNRFYEDKPFNSRKDNFREINRYTHLT